jgi:peptide/nickel transport system substrate-binding protein/microcin C transport system substrate-binding protein
MKFLSVLLLSVFLTSGVAQAAKKGGTFYYNLETSPTTLNPLSAVDYYSSLVHNWVMETLLERDNDTYDWNPSLATEWEISKDGLQYTFTLREGVKWHDGKPLTAEDVKFSFDAVMHPENKYKTAHQKPYFENIDRVEILAPNKVKFVAKKVYFGNFQVVATMDIVPKHIYESPSKKAAKKLNKTAWGSGPYKVDKFQKGKKLILKKNKDWWGNSDPSKKNDYNFEKIHMRFVKDSTIAITRIEKGDIDFQSLTSEEYVKKTSGSKWGKKVFKVKTENVAPKGYGFIGWNFKKPMFQSRNVRLALYHLINRDLMNEKFLFGNSIPATGPWYQQSEYADPSVKPIPFDPKKALELLRADGWKAGDDNILQKKIDGKMTKLSFTIIEPNKDFIKYLTMFKEDAKKAGVDVNIKFVEWNTFIKLLDEKNFDACRLGWSGGSVDLDPKQIWHSSSARAGGSNFTSYSNPEVDKLIDESRVLFDKKKRVAALRKVYKKIAEDVPYAFFFNAKYIFYAHTKKMKRAKDTFNYSVNLPSWWIEK